MSQLISWTDIELCHHGFDLSKSWFIYFTLRNQLTGEEIRKQYRGGINAHHSKEARIKHAHALTKYWEEQLRQGKLNPWKDPAAIGTAEIPKTVKDALDKVLALKSRTLKPKSLRGYKDIHRWFTEWLERQGYEGVRLYQFSPAMARAYLDHLLLEKNYSGKSYNNQHGILHAFFSAMMAKGREWIKENPFSGIEELPEDSGNHVPYGPEERDRIGTHLKTHDRRMYFAIQWIFHTYIRKTELTTIQVKDIDFENKTIRVNAKAAKNRHQDSVAISAAFLPILLEMGLDLAPREFYVFGKGMLTSIDKMTRPDDISDRYLELKKEMGYKAGDGRTFYSWKHTGAIAYWNAIKDPYVLMRQLRHSDLKTTMIYLRSLGLNPNFQFLAASVEL